MQKKRNSIALAIGLRLFFLDLYNLPMKATYGVYIVVPAVLFPYRIILEHVFTRLFFLVFLFTFCWRKTLLETFHPILTLVFQSIAFQVASVFWLIGCCNKWLYFSPGSVKLLYKHCKLMKNWQVKLTGTLTFCFFIVFLCILKWIVTLYCVLSMRRKTMIPMYKLWSHGLYGLHEVRWPRKPVKLNNSLTHLKTALVAWQPIPRTMSITFFDFLDPF